MEKLTEDNEGIVTKFTETLANSVSDNGRKLLIGYAKTDELGQIIRRTYEMTVDNDGNISGSDDMNTVKFFGKITGNNNQQVISVNGNYINGSNEIFGMDLIYQNTETGKQLQMKLELSISADNLVDQYSGNNTFNGMEIETRPANGENQFVSYWQVLNFKPESE